jgi:amino acid adenylation domain-containing protein
LEEGLEYWKGQLAGVERLELPTDRARPAQPTYAGGAYQVVLMEEQTAGLKRVSQENQVTLYMTLLAGLGVLLGRYSGQEDIVVGSPIANRQDAQLEGLIGFFLNTLVLRMRVSGEKSFRELLEEVRGTTLEAYRHQDIPFERLVEMLAPQRSLSATPIFQVTLTMQNTPWVAPHMEGLALEAVVGDEPQVRSDLMVHAWEVNGNIGFSWVYSTDLFDGWKIERMTRHYVRLLEAVADNVGETVGAIDLLGREERRQILEEWNDTRREYVSEKWVHELFEEQVERIPEALAVVYEDRSLSYGELNRRANQLAHYLRERQVGPEKLVALAAPRSFEMIVAILGILKTGAAYLPLDTDYPPERLALILQDASPAMVLTTVSVVLHLPNSVPRMVLDDPDTVQELSRRPAANMTNAQRVCTLNPHHSAYVIYTSGSTGRPKGVLIEHQSLRNYLLWSDSAFYDTSGAGSPIVHSIGFDGVITTLFGPFVAGQAVTLLARGDEPGNLGRLCSSESIPYTLLKVTPSHLKLINESIEISTAKGPAQTLMIGGEALVSEDVAFWQHLFPGVRIINHFGPTETTVGCCAFEISKTTLGTSPPIGRPIWNTQVYVLDNRLELVPVGVKGELYIAGMGLARGYLNQPGLTAERFVANPYGEGTRIYRSGDLVRWRSEGVLDFLGRADSQVKIRGFRIEPGEVEAALRCHSAVAQAAVIARQDGGSHLQLVGYVTASVGASVDVAELRADLAKKLPEYMVPAVIVVLPQMPLTTNGKVDWKALPVPERAGGSHRVPRTPEEEILCDVFEELLGIERVGLDDDFFALGGHSLLAIRLVSRVRTQLNVELAIRTLFEAPTVAQLSDHLRDAGRVQREKLKRQARTERVPLSYAQQGLWILDRLQGGQSTEYNQPQARRLRGELDVEALRRAVQMVVERHESLRTHFVEVEGEPVQVIEPEVEIAIPVEDLCGMSEVEKKERVREALREEGRKPFDLERGPMLRMKLLKLGERDHVLLRTTHHIVWDEWSQGVFNREFEVLYEAYREGRENPLEPLPVQYADFALWQRKWLGAGVLDEGMEYWKGQLAGIAERRLELPLDRVRPAVQTFSGGAYQVVLTEEQAAGVKGVSQENHATLYMTLLTGLGVLLARYSGQEDIVVGSPIANRQDAQLEELIGFFLNTLVLRMRVKGEQSFRGLLEEVRRTTLEAYRYQDVPFERLVEVLAPERSLSRTPIFQVTLTMHNALQSPQMEDLELKNGGQDDVRVRTDLELHVLERWGKIDLWLLYNKDVFEGWRMEQMARHYVRVLQGMINDVEQEVGGVEILGREERRQVIEEWNATEREVEERTVVELFEEQVKRTPEAVAVMYEDRQLSYMELNAQANRLAHRLKTLGVKPESCVAICMERSPEMIVAVLGTLKVGAAYVPLDPAYPDQRKVFVITDSGAKIVFSVEKMELPLMPAVTRVDVDRLVATEGEIYEAGLCFDDRALAYIMYTSGSTGQPKGVMVPHRAIKRLVLGNGYARFEASDRVAFAANPAFDASTLEIWAPLLNGGCIVVVDQDVLLDPVSFGQLLKADRVSVLWLTAGLFDQYAIPLNESIGDLRYLLVGGDALNPRTIAWTLHHNAPKHLLNGYGPTETTTFATTHEIRVGDENRPSISIGRPIANTRIYVLDERLGPLPVGVRGELYIGGAGVARGYLGRAGQTGERFVADPYGGAGERMYRSGDWARWGVGGEVEFLGRSDDQVKIRGFRIELGEIEAGMREQEGVKEAVVVVRGEDGDKQLVAYAVAEEGKKVEVKRIVEGMRRRVPEYMVPGTIVVLEQMPLTANGKLDRKRLPEPETRVEGYRGPRSPEEEILCGLYEKLLGVERVGLEDDFFALGGHSLLAITLVSWVRSVMGVELEIGTVFEHPRIGELSRHLREGVKGREELRVLERPERLPLSYAQQRLWFLDRLQGGRSTEYNQLQARRLRGELNVEALRRAVQTIVDRHESLRTCFAEVEGEPVQVIEPEVEIAIPVEDLRGMSEAGQKKWVRDAMREERRTPFDLERGPVLRMKLLKLGEREHVLLRTTHHIVSDGWSEGVFNREFEVLYEAYREGRENPLEPLPVQYADFAVWQRKWLEGGALEEGLEYWKGQLAGIEERLELPADRVRPAQPTYAGGAYRVVLTEEQAAGVKRICQENQVTLYMLLLAGLGVLLARYSGQEDIVVGSPIANRQDAQLEGLIGFFLNTLVLRMRVSGEKSFRELLEEVRRTTLEAYRYQDVPFERLVEMLAPERSLNGTPLCQVVLTMHNTPWVAQRLGELALESVTDDEFQVRFDLTVHAWEADGKVGFSWLYNKDVFAGRRIEQMARHYVRVLETIITNAAD